MFNTKKDIEQLAEVIDDKVAIKRLGWVIMYLIDRVIQLEKDALHIKFLKDAMKDIGRDVLNVNVKEKH